MATKSSPGLKFTTHSNAINSEKHRRNFYGIDILTATHPAIRKLKKNNTPSIHGNKFWGSSYLLMDYFEQNPIKTQSRVMELGCGWGLAGMYMAKQHDAQVTAVDADADVFPYLDLHAQINQIELSKKCKRFEQLSKKHLANIDVLIGADICFWDELSDALYKLIRRALQAGVKKVVIADPERAPFFELAELCMEQFYAELESWSVDQPRRTRGSLLIIENA